MEANESKVEEFLSQSKTQFIIPIYQRNYDWSASQCKQFLDDILKVARNENMNAHFIGSIVHIYDGTYISSNIRKLTIIDGQQRLTTLTLIYLTLYRIAMEMNDKMRQKKIDKCLTNQSAPEDKKLKLRLTKNNDEALKYLTRDDTTEEYIGFSKIIENFNYFKNRITRENKDFVSKGISKLMFVEVSLDRAEDDPQRIFESLNSTGLELSQADLIRNYILMGLNLNNQTEIYNNYWKIIEKLAKDESSNVSKVSDFIRDYLTLKKKKIPNKDKVYLEFKANFATSDLEKLEKNLSPIKSLVKYYNKLLNPKNESDREIRTQLEYINRLEINVAFPFLMQVYKDYSENKIDKINFIKVLEFIQSFVWRRFILELPTNTLNKIFMTVYEKIDKDDYLISLQRWILKKSGRQRFPKNNELKERLKVKDVYNIKSKSKTYLLERFENFENREPVIIEGNTDITIEHIFPQNPDAKWKDELEKEEYNYIKETYLNTIGNLTLLGNNGKLGNRTFINKRDMENAGYKDSRLWLNKYLSNIDKWNRKEIESRFELLYERFLKIWDYPNIELNEREENNEINIFEAEDPKHKKLEYAIFLDQKIEVNQVGKLYLEIFKQLFDLQPETFFSTDLAERIALTKNPEKNLRRVAQINDTYFIEINIDNIRKFKRIKYALKVFNFEDKLTIKYAENE